MEDFTLIGILQEQLANLAQIIPNLVGAMAIFFIGWFIAKMLARIVKKLLVSVGVDSLAEKLNEIEIVEKSNIKIIPSVLISKILYYLIFFISIMAATDVLGMKAISDLMTNIMNYIPSLISALVVLIIGVVIADVLKKIVQTTCDSLGIPASKMISNLVFYFIFLNVIMITLKQASLQTDFIETNISIILAGVVLAFAIGYGMASRGLMSNMLSSFYNKEKIKLGHTVIIDGTKGKIISIDSTTLTLQASNSKVIIPLSKLTSEKVEILED
ncbi:MAG: hypothetical protein DHS20C18_22460 [Saprospiraceae bacterium]|nr:MAG: hypothetical protein DHS20C18_22460 [Saprospiraceae bacterium]